MRSFVVVLLSAASHGLALAQSAPAGDGLGVLLMAHGGSDEWNAGVLSAVEPLEDEYRIEVAFGMADAVSVQEGVSRLEEAGADRIAVVRLFISGESWFERTRQILGLADGAPARPPEAGGETRAGPGGHSMEFWRVESDAAFEMSVEGLAEAPEMGGVVADRARALSRDPAREDVLILAHGTGDDEENRRWLRYMETHAERVREALPFHEVAVETLREDWPEKRALARERIRTFVADSSAAGRRTIVVPFRVHGFGPYAEVLEGLDYASDGRGLVPHPSVTEWIARQISILLDE